jgi:predicted RNase H-like HicB family nuclease
MVKGRTITINVSVWLKKREDCWEAYFEPLGMTVYGDTREDVNNRVQQAIEFFVKHTSADDDGIQRVRDYLDSHGILYSITDDDSARPVHRTYPISVPIEAPGVA